MRAQKLKNCPIYFGHAYTCNALDPSRGAHFHEGSKTPQFILGTHIHATHFQSVVTYNTINNMYMHAYYCSCSSLCNGVLCCA